MAEAFFLEVRKQAEAGKLLSREHFSLDGTLVEAAASLKSFRLKKEGAKGENGGRRAGGDGPGEGDQSPTERVSEGGGRDRNPSVDFHGEKRTNKTHASTTDPEALLAKHSPGEAAWPMPVICSPRTATASSSRPISPRPPAPPNGRSEPVKPNETVRIG